MINILVASRYEEVRKRILAAISGQKDFFIAGIAGDETGAIIKAERLKPNVLVLDIDTLGISGPEIAPIIHRRSPDTAIVVLCDKDEDNYAAGLALKAGISGFLLKETDMGILAPVIKIVFSGGYYFSAPITIRVFSAVTFMSLFPGQITENANRLSFSPTERGIVTDIALGLSDEEIAKHLNYSTGTIKNRVTAIKRKTKMKSRTQIVIYSLVYGLISFEQLGFWENKSGENNH